MVANGSSRLSDGVIIETSVLARLMGIKLLTLEGTVLVSPAQLQERYHAHATPDAVPVAVTRHQAPAERLNGGSAARSGAPDEAVGARLAAAARLLDESSRDLRSIEHRS